MELAILILAIPVFVLMVVTGLRSDRALVADSAKAKGWTDVDVRWAPWILAKYGRRYTVVYTDPDGHRRKRHCVIALLKNEVYWEDDSSDASDEPVPSPASKQGTAILDEDPAPRSWGDEDPWAKNASR